MLNIRLPFFSSLASALQLPQRSLPHHQENSAEAQQQNDPTFDRGKATPPHGLRGSNALRQAVTYSEITFPRRVFSQGATTTCLLEKCGTKCTCGLTPAKDQDFSSVTEMPVASAFCRLRSFKPSADAKLTRSPDRAGSAEADRSKAAA